MRFRVELASYIHMEVKYTKMGCCFGNHGSRRKKGLIIFWVEVGFMDGKLSLLPPGDPASREEWAWELDLPMHQMQKMYLLNFINLMILFIENISWARKRGKKTEFLNQRAKRPRHTTHGPLLAGASVCCFSAGVYGCVHVCNKTCVWIRYGC